MVGTTFQLMRAIINNTDLGPLDRFKLMVTAYHMTVKR